MMLPQRRESFLKKPLMPVFRPRLLVVLLEIAVAALSSAPAQTAAASPPSTTLDSVTGAQALRDGVELRAGSASLRITALRDDIIRVRISAESTLPEDASWSVLSGPRSKSVDVQPTEEASSVGFRTASLDVRVERNPLRLVIRDLAGNVISCRCRGTPHQISARRLLGLKQMPVDEHYFGLGDKTGTFDRRNQAYTLWNTDIGPQESIDPLYKSIPFFLAINGTRSYGVFLDNTWRTWFDFGKQARDAYSFGAEGGPLDYYLIYGPTPKQVVEGYAYLTGTPPLPPLWALGFQQSRYSYTPESQAREIADRLRADKIPSDVLYLDIDYQYKNRPFTVDPANLPQLSRTGFGSAQTALPLGQHHRSPHRACSQPELCALRHRRSRRPFREECRRQRVRRHRVAGPRSLSRFHPRPDPRMVGRPL